MITSDAATLLGMVETRDFQGNRYGTRNKVNDVYQSET